MPCSGDITNSQADLIEEAVAGIQDGTLDVEQLSQGQGVRLVQQTCLRIVAELAGRTCHSIHGYFKAVSPSTAY